MMNRRDFLRTSAASALLLGLGARKILAATGADLPGNAVPWVTLNNGVRMPRLGLGTMTLRGDLGVRCVADALSLGYRLIDTAMIYDNEASVGEGVRQSGIKREELFITSKLWATAARPEDAAAALARTCADLRTPYVDLYLIH